MLIQMADAYGQRVTRAYTYMANLWALFYFSLRSGLLNRTQSYRSLVSVLSAQIYFTGFQALPLITVLAVAAGAVVVMQSTGQFSLLGGGASIGQLVVVVVVRELAPFMTALIVIARSGTAVASELGNMKVNREIQALESMGIDPLSYIVFPRLLGGVISLVCLSFYFVMSSVVGGLVVAKVLQGLPAGYFLDSVAQAITEMDVILFLVKNIFSGILIFSIAMVQGLRVHEGPHEVPQVTTRAVMDSIIVVVGFNLSLTALYYLSHLKSLGVL